MSRLPVVRIRISAWQAVKNALRSLVTLPPPPGESGPLLRLPDRVDWNRCSSYGQPLPCGLARAADISQRTWWSVDDVLEAGYLVAEHRVAPGAKPDDTDWDWVEFMLCRLAVFPGRALLSAVDFSEGPPSA